MKLFLDLLHFPAVLRGPPSLSRAFPLVSPQVAIGVVFEAMMAAAGCGSATAAAIGGQVGTAAPRGRFPGRPWSSRSRLRSEKRWQLDRSGAEADDVTNVGGPRPSSLVLALNEDQSHLRLLGIESNHKNLAEAGYSSSGSEEVRAQIAAGVSIFLLLLSSHFGYLCWCVVLCVCVM